MFFVLRKLSGQITNTRSLRRLAIDDLGLHVCVNLHPCHFRYPLTFVFLSTLALASFMVRDYTRPPRPILRHHPALYIILKY